jgi:hypothetical protein
VQVFLSLFIGRKDRFAKRYYSKKNGSYAYTPVCGNEWNDAFCNKLTKEYTGAGRSLCAQCPHPAYLPFGAAAVSNHLRGFYKDHNGKKQDFIAGIYPLMDGNTCRFLSVDFDAHYLKSDVSQESLLEEVAVFRQSCKANGVPAYVERSRSGKGFHVWIFFSEPVAAASARKMGSGLITYAMEHCGEVSFTTYDRLFPGQDFLPQGGFGNLIALPLQRACRSDGNTVFLDDNFIPYEDQWAFLSGVERMNSADVGEIVARIGASPDGLGELAAEDDDSKPWEKRRLPSPLGAVDFPCAPEIVISNMIFIPRAALSAKAANRIRRLAVMKNPEYSKKLRMRLPIVEIPRINGKNLLTDFSLFIIPTLSRQLSEGTRKIGTL